MKLSYFDLPGRGEAARLCMVVGGIAFTDDRVAFADWPRLKAETPWLTLPYVELEGGRRIAQTHAILRFLGSQTTPRLYPTDLVQAACVDELLDAVNDIQVVVNAAGQGLPPEEKEAKRKEAVESGTAYTLLSKLDSYIAANGAGGHAVGDALTIADIKIFTALTFIVSGFFDGVPATALDGFSNIQAVRKTTALVPQIKSYYDTKELLPLEKGLKDAQGI